MPLLVLAVCALAACSGYEPAPYQDQREEGGPGGVFSGEQGEFIIYERPAATARGDKRSNG